MSSKEHGVGRRRFQKEADQNPRLSGSQQPWKRRAEAWGSDVSGNL